MRKNSFTEKEMNILFKYPYVKSVTQRGLRILMNIQGALYCTKRTREDP